MSSLHAARLRNAPAPYGVTHRTGRGDKGGAVNTFARAKRPSSRHYRLLLTTTRRHGYDGYISCAAFAMHTGWETRRRRVGVGAAEPGGTRLGGRGEVAYMLGMIEGMALCGLCLQRELDELVSVLSYVSYMRPKMSFPLCFSDDEAVGKRAITMMTSA